MPIGSIWPAKACGGRDRPSEIHLHLTNQKLRNIINPDLRRQTASGRLPIGMHGRLRRNPQPRPRENKMLKKLTLAALLVMLVGSAHAGDVDAAANDYNHQDYPSALRLYQPLAERGSAEAQYRLCEMNAKGFGMSQNLPQAAAWCLKAAEQGHVEAQRTLGEWYSISYAMPGDHMQAIYWFRKAAQQGDVSAQYTLSWTLHKDDCNGCEEEAFSWRLKAAEKGVSGAQSDLGYNYEIGDGVKQDYARAVYWYRKAANGPDVSTFMSLKGEGKHFAQYRLGDAYEKGHGVPRDYARAYAWFSIAAAASKPGELQAGVLKHCDDVAAKMTWLELATAHLLASEGGPTY
jgi:hypothetical protein